MRMLTTLIHSYIAYPIYVLMYMHAPMDTLHAYTIILSIIVIHHVHLLVYCVDTSCYFVGLGAIYRTKRMPYFIRKVFVWDTICFCVYL